MALSPLALRGARGRSLTEVGLVWHADRILVMNEGRLIEQGTHAELIARAGVYAELVASQLQ
jgi:ABC-type multidrug transport system fused ATPase/permease subunit